MSGRVFERGNCSASDESPAKPPPPPIDWARMPHAPSPCVVMLASLDLARRALPGRAALPPLRLALPPILAVGFLSLLVGAHYAGYHPFHGDLGCSPLEEWMVTGFAMIAVVLAAARMPKIAACAALLSILTFPSGLLWVALLGGAGALAGGHEHRGAVRNGSKLAADLACAYLPGDFSRPEQQHEVEQAQQHHGVRDIVLEEADHRLGPGCAPVMKRDPRSER